MRGYRWAKMIDGALFVVLLMDGKGYVPGREDAIDLSQIDLLEPVQWPNLGATPSPASELLKYGAPVPAATRECAILPFVANA